MVFCKANNKHYSNKREARRELGNELFNKYVNDNLFVFPEIKRFSMADYGYC